jgi:hypothetical protein
MVTARNASVSETACSGPTTDPSTLHLRVTVAGLVFRVTAVREKRVDQRTGHRVLMSVDEARHERRPSRSTIVVDPDLRP